MEYIPMAPNTALLVGLLGIALLITTALPSHRATGVVVSVLLSACILVAGLTLAGILSGIDLGIDSFFVVANGTSGLVPVGRMSPVSAGCFLLGSCAIHLLRVKKRDPAALLGTVLTLISGIILIGYLYGAPLLYGGTVIPVALTTALAFGVLGVGLVTAAGPAIWPLSGISGDSTRARLLRGLLPVMLLVVLLAHWSEAVITGNVDSTVVLASAVTILATLFITYFAVSLLSRSIGDTIDRSEQERKTAEHALAESERKYRNLYHFAQVGLFETSLKDAAVVACNQRYADLAGFGSVEDTLGKDVLKLYVNPEDRTEVSRILREKGYIENHIVRFRNQSTGKVFWGQFSARYNSGRDVAEGTIIDITAQKEAEELLRENTARLSLALGVGNAGVWEWDTDTNEVRFDAGFHELLGYQDGELPGTLEEWLPFHNQEEVPVWMAKAEAYIRGETPMYESEHRIRTRAGEWAWVFTRGQFVNSPEMGSKKLFVGIAMNITGRKHADEILRESEQRFRTILDWTYDWEYWISPNRDINYVSPSVQRITGYSPAEFIADKFLIDRIIHPEDHALWQEHILLHTELQHQENQGQIEFRIIRKDGTIRWIGHICRPIYAENGRWIGTRISNRDITDRKNTEEVLRESGRRLQEAQGLAHLGFWSWDMKTGRVEWSDEVFRIFGLDPNVFNPDIDSILALSPWPGEQERDRELIQKAIESREPGTYEQRFLRPDKSIGYYHSTFQGRYDANGNLIAIVGTVLDITGRKESEEYLKSSETRYRRLFESAKDGILILNYDTGEIIDANPFIATLLGYPTPDLLGKHLWDIGLFKDQLLSKVAFEELLTREYLRYEDLPLETRNGRRIDVEFVSNVYPLDSRTTVIQCNIRDITDRRLAEKQLRETNDYLKNLIDYANAPIIVWDPELRITRFNHAFERLTGRTELEVIDRHLEILFPETSRAASLEQIRKTLAGERWEIVEIPILHVSGETRVVLWNSANIVDPAGKIISTIAQGQDITERKMAEDALRRSEEKYRVLFTRMIEGSALHEMVYDPSGNPIDYRIIDANPAFESIIGISREAVVGKTSREVYEVTTPPYLDIYARVAATGEPAWFEEYFVPLKKHFAISAYSPGPGKFATIFEDVTDRKLAEVLREHLIKELEQKNAELERFTYTVSHDLKSPLITIKGFAGLIEEDVRQGDPLQLKKDLHRIMAAAETMQELLADVLELARIGKIVNPPETIAFNRIAEDAVDLLAGPLAGPLAERNIKVEIAPGLPVVRVDHARMREVMVNLLENAIKFTASRPDPVIRIGADMSGTTPVFFVQDNGIGIEPRYLERIFNLFERLDVSTHGTGIGLTIVRRIIEVHGGKIWAESDGPGKGATFRFTLPDARDERS
ncbi:PAS domain S-box protein [Methanoregula sp.]|uniref:PAS domain S-box protein n=1 Tax=Methanoregula sp. TaxID=2052170 RepID=UPI003566CEA1